MFAKYYTDIEVWQTDYIHQMKDTKAVADFVKATALISYLERLTNTQQTEFMEILYHETAKKISQTGKRNGIVPVSEDVFYCTLTNELGG